MGVGLWVLGSRLQGGVLGFGDKPLSERLNHKKIWYCSTWTYLRGIYTVSSDLSPTALNPKPSPFER